MRLKRIGCFERSLRRRALSRFVTLEEEERRRNIEGEGRKCVRCATNRIIEFSIGREGIYIYRRDSRKGCAGEGEGMIDGTSRLSRKLF